MKDYIAERAVLLATYLLETGATVRAAALVHNVSKSTVHKDVTERLLLVDPALAARVKSVLEVNLNERHVRGGQATRNKYASQKH